MSPGRTDSTLRAAAFWTWLAACGSFGQEQPPAPELPPPPRKDDSKDDQATAQVEWLASFDEAVRRAADEQRSILVAVNMDGEIACQTLAERTYRDKKFVDASRAFICVICSIGEHSQTPDVVGTPICDRFGRVSCADHRKSEIRASETLIGTDEVIAPQHVIVAPDGRVLVRRAWQIALDDLVKLMNGALRRAGLPGATAPDPKAEKAEIEGLLRDAEKASSYRKDEPIQRVLELDSEAAREALFAYLEKGSDDETRAEILAALGRSGDYTVLDAVRGCLKDRKTFVAMAAVDALGAIRLPAVLPDLEKCLKQFRAGNDYGRVLRAYASCGRDDPKVAELVLRQARGSDQNVRAHALVAMGSLPGSEALDAYLRKALDDKITTARACAAYAVGLGRHAGCREALETLAKTETVLDVKEVAARALLHLDHDPADASCCSLEGSISTFVNLGDTRR
jgi:hypothetical protein